MYLALTVRDVIKPAVDPPPGVISNFDNPASRGQGVIVAGVVLLLLSLLFVSIRLYTRIWVTRALGWDDCTFLRPSRVAAATRFVCLVSICTDRY